MQGKGKGAKPAAKTSKAKPKASSAKKNRLVEKKPRRYDFAGSPK
ncbi:MAG TPA: hypothetical protein VLK37_09245 [Solirubrobacterales bacterium]|nr:hypothetical protein [Solirubrobacterales bacterium]